MRATRWLVLSLLAAGAAAACVATAPPSSTASATKTPRLAGQPMTACTVRGEIPVAAELTGYCGTLDVPEDRSDPASRTIGLRVVVVPAGSAEPKPDPVFAVAGGPGDASTTFFAWLPDHYAALHQAHDIVLVDQRGTGASNAATLPPMPDTGQLSAAEADARLRAWADDSLRALDLDPRMYTSTVAADDLDDVRAALGYDPIDVYGTSYGGTLIQYYLRQHGEHVRVAVLDGATPLDVPVFERMAANSAAALDRLLARCAADPACGRAFPNIVAEWSALERALAHGVTTEVVDPATGQHAVADLGMVGPSIHGALLTQATASVLPLAIHLAAGGAFERGAMVLGPGPSATGPMSVMATEIECSEAWARMDPDAVRQAGGDSYATPMFVTLADQRARLCRWLPGGTVPDDDATASRTDVPMLWLTADADPQDPPENLTTLTSWAPKARIAVMPAQEHVVGHLGCGPSVIAAFVDRGSSDGLDVSCIAAGPGSALTFRLP